MPVNLCEGDRRWLRDAHDNQPIRSGAVLLALKRPQAKELIAGAVASMGSAQMSLALEFASAARPDPGLSNNQGWAENRAPISANETRAGFSKNAANGTTSKSGKSSEQAWAALSMQTYGRLRPLSNPCVSALGDCGHYVPWRNLAAKASNVANTGSTA